MLRFIRQIKMFVNEENVKLMKHEKGYLKNNNKMKKVQTFLLTS